MSGGIPTSSNSVSVPVQVPGSSSAPSFSSFGSWDTSDQFSPFASGSPTTSSSPFLTGFGGISAALSTSPMGMPTLGTSPGFPPQRTGGNVMTCSRCSSFCDSNALRLVPCLHILCSLCLSHLRRLPPPPSAPSSAVFGSDPSSAACLVCGTAIHSFQSSLSLHGR